MQFKRIIDFTRNIFNNLSNRAYLFSLLLSILFWCLIKLSKPYSTNLDYTVQFTNLPTSLLLIDYSPKDISIHVKGHGFNLLSHYFSSDELSVDLSEIIKKEDGTYEWVVRDHFSDIVQQIPFKEEIEKINTDRIRLNLKEISQKKIPVVLEEELIVESGFVIDTIYFKPDSIIVIAPLEALEKMINFKLKFNQENKIKNDFSKELLVENPEYWNTNISTFELNVRVDNLTQGKIKVPIHVLNAPLSSKVKLFPDEVELLFNIPTKYYHGINERDFMVKADFNKVDTTNGKVHLELIQIPDKVELMALKPNVIDYLFIYQ
mgnify:CR=1 FL=1